MFRNVVTATAAVLFAGGTAIAADLPSRAPQPVYVPPPPIFTWTGFYVGGQLGYQWDHITKSTFNAAGAFVANEPTGTPSGIVGGAHLGYNWQTGQIVLGLEGDVEGSSLHATGTNAAGTLLSTAREPFESTIRGRIGWAWDRALI